MELTKAFYLLVKGTDRDVKQNLTLFFIFTKITMQMAMSISVTTTPTSTPSTGVICTSTARDDAGNCEWDKKIVIS